MSTLSVEVAVPIPVSVPLHPIESTCHTRVEIFDADEVSVSEFAIVPARVTVVEPFVNFVLVGLVMDTTGPLLSDSCRVEVVVLAFASTAVI